ncbi:hypothetical protein LSCM1_02775 [Leishmania martiniquensis]|uniref:GRIP domain-containing protein n=1 Tax=Leishmania martiniquensis TaxID=1580590 RepID=A0A836KEF9_9TRYP|nr:hypothetical protein LSCM1_02775 [Leishmania martiniquensis]
MAHARAYDQNNPGAAYGRGGSASVTETTARRLVLQYNEPTEDYHASADAALCAEASQISAVAAPFSPSQQTSPSPTAGASTLKNGVIQASVGACGDDAIRGPFYPLGAAQDASIPPSERRGPPRAMMTPSPQLAASQRSPLQLAASLSSASAAPMPSLPLEASAKEVTSSRATTAALSASLAQPQHVPGPAQSQLQRIAALEAEREQMLSSMQKYQDDVRCARERTVQYYEAKLKEVTASAPQANVAEEMIALRTALQAAVDELEGEKAVKTTLEERVEKLQQHADELRARLAAAQEEVTTMEAIAAAAATAAPAASVKFGSTSAPAEADWRRHHHEELERLETLVDEQTVHLAAQAAQLECAEANRRALEARLQEAEAEAMARLTGIHDRSGDALLEERQHALQDEVDSLKRELAEERHRSSERQVLLEDAQREKEALAAQLSTKQAIAESDAVALEETPLPPVAAAATAAAPAAHEKEWKQLVDKLALEEAQRGVLEREVQQLKEAADQLQRTLDRREHEHAAALAKAQTALVEKANSVGGQTMEVSQTDEEELRDLRTNLEEEHRRGNMLEADKQAALETCVAAEAQAAAAEYRCCALQAKLDAFQQQASRCEEEERLRVAASESAVSSADLSVTVLTQVKNELAAKVQTLEGTMDQLRRMTVGTLVRLGVDLEHILHERHPQSGTDEERCARHDDAEDDGSKNKDRGRAGAVAELPLLQLFSLLTAECLEQHSLVLRAERVQQEWEQTYAQARHVNDSLNQQMADAWSIIGKLREELSVKEEATRQMQARVESGDAHLVETQEQVAVAMHELQTLREEREGWAARLRQSESGVESQAKTVSSLQEELHALQEMLQGKEEELQASLQSMENLQVVLDRFQENRRQEVEALTLESQVEVEELKKQLSASLQINDQHASEVAGLHESFEQQMAAKDAEVTTMHRKLAEVRKALEKTTSRHMDSSETSIDKRVVSQLLAKCMHAFLEQRREAEDMLKVLSGLLDWDEATQELVGLLPGPNNPLPLGSRSSQGGSGRRSLFRWLRSGTNSSVPQSAVTSTDGTAGTSKAGLAAMWVEFLLKESEGKRGAATLSPPASSALGSQPNPSFSSPPPSAATATVTAEAAESSPST